MSFGITRQKHGPEEAVSLPAAGRLSDDYLGEAHVGSTPAYL